MCSYVHACFLTRKESVGARQAGLVRGIPPAQPPQAAAALLHLHQGGVMNSRELLTTPCRVTLATHTHPWQEDDGERFGMMMRMKEVKEEGRGRR